MARDATFSDLPDSLLARILVALVSPEPGEESSDAHELAAGQALSSACLVCKRWRQAVYAEPALWRSFTLLHRVLADAAEERLAQWASATFSLLQRVGRHITAFSAHEVDAFEAGAAGTSGCWSLLQLLRLLHPSRLTALILHCRELHDATAQAAACFPQLTALSLGTSAPLLPACTPDVLRQLPRLQRLRLNAHFSHEAEPLLSSIGQLTGLTWLDFLTPGLTPPKIQLTQLTQLRHLRLYGGKLQPPGLAAFPRLSSYDLEHVGFGGDSALRCAMSRGGMLWLNGTGTQPALKTCRRPLQPAVLNALLPQGCSALLPLTRLELSCCELPIEVAACSQLSSLVALRLCECHSWDPLPPGDNADGSDSDSDDESIVLEAQLALSSTTLTSLLRQAPGLAALSIEDSLDAECATLQSTELPPGLTSFSLRGNDLSGVFEGPYPPALVDLDLGCNEFTRLPPQVLECTGLTRLALDGNDDLALTSAEARRLLSRLPQLVRLELGAESLLTPRVRQTLLEGRPDLQLSFTWGETESEGTTSGSSSEEEEDEL